MTQRWDNTFRLYQDGSKIIEDVQYISGSTVVTEGQPYIYHPTINSEMHGYWDITLSSGRKKSKSPRDVFLDNCGGSHKILSYENETHNDDSTPKELNFTFGIRIKLGGEWFDLYVGQGSNVFSTNWWCGSKQLADRHISYGQYFQGRDNMRYHLDWSSSSDIAVVALSAVKTH